MERLSRLEFGRVRFTCANATWSLSVIVAVTSVAIPYSATGGLAATFEIWGLMRSAQHPVVNTQEAGFPIAFPGSLASIAEALTSTQCCVFGARFVMGSRVNTMSPPLQLYVTGIHADEVKSWMATVAGIPVAPRFIASSNVTITSVAVEIPVEPF